MVTVQVVASVVIIQVVASSCIVLQNWLNSLPHLHSTCSPQKGEATAGPASDGGVSHFTWCSTWLLLPLHFKGQTALIQKHSLAAHHVS